MGEKVTVPVLEFKLLTLFPDIFNSFLSESLMQKALEKGLIDIETIDYREFGIGKHRKVDAPPYGGGAGMVLRPEPIYQALQKCEEQTATKGLHKILVSPQGQPFNQEKARELSQKDVPIALVCGRFEGFDERIRGFVDEELSLGDFVLLGGEVAAMAILEATCRLVPGVIGNHESLDSESHADGLLEYSQFTRPHCFQGLEVPEILLSGHHENIRNWRLANSLQKTKKQRPDLYKHFLNLESRKKNS